MLFFTIYRTDLIKKLQTEKPEHLFRSYMSNFIVFVDN